MGKRSKMTVSIGHKVKGDKDQKVTGHKGREVMGVNGCEVKE